MIIRCKDKDFSIEFNTNNTEAHHWLTSREETQLELYKKLRQAVEFIIKEYSTHEPRRS